MFWWLACTGEPVPEAIEAPAPARAVNLLIVSLDTVRADHLGPYGYERPTTPALDVLASQGTVYERVFTPVATTLPSHLSLLTGAYPLEHGLLSNHGNHRDDASRYARKAELLTLGQAASAAGWDTAAFVSAAPLKRHSGLHVGFDVFEQPEGAERRAADTLKLAVPWLLAEREAPFFALVHLFDAHYPYAAPAPYGARFEGAPGTAELLAARGAADTFTATVNTADGAVVKEQKSMVTLVDAYDGELAYLDAALGDLFRQLSVAGLLDETVVVVVGDHGEGLGQHGEWMHGNVHQEQLHVPMIVRVPGQAPSRDGRLLSLADLPSVVLPEVEGDWSGFLAQVPPRAEGVLGQRTASLRQDLGGGMAWTWFDGRYKVVSDDVGAVLYDLELDPLEQVPVDDPDRLASMVALLDEVKAAQAARLGALRDFGSGEDPLEAGMMRKADAVPLEELRALGYVE